MKCRRCKEYQARIETAPDSIFRMVKCLACGYWEWLNNYKHKYKTLINNQ